MTTAHESPRRQLVAPLPLLLATFFVTMSFGTVLALLADLRAAYGLPGWALGLITGSTFVAVLAVQVGLSRYADRGRARLLMRSGIVAAGASALLFAVGTDVVTFVMARTLLGVGAGCFLPAARRVVLSADPTRPGALLGRFAVFDFAGFVLGPPIAAIIATTLGLKAPFWLQGALLLGCLPFVWRVAEPTVHERAPRGAARLLLARRDVRAGLAIAAAIYLSFGVFETIWSQFMKEHGASTTVIGLSLALYGIPAVFLSPFGGRLADRSGPLIVGQAGAAGMAVVALGFPIVDSVVLACVLAIISASLEAVSVPAGQAAVAKAGGRSLFATGQGLFSATGAACAAIAAVAAAPLYDAIGSTGVFLITAALMGTLAATSRILGRASGQP